MIPASFWNCRINLQRHVGQGGYCNSNCCLDTRQGSPKGYVRKSVISNLSYYRILDRQPIANPIIPIFIIKTIISKKREFSKIRMLSALPRHIVSRLPLSQLVISTKKQSHYSSLSYFCKLIYLICQGIIAHHLFIGYDADNAVAVMLHKNSPLSTLGILHIPRAEPDGCVGISHS